jgi:diaminohydroxyphosphoribosylaminopyrimidine deaminase/5-amino-6-(5-phosphoribosylamino)uracil reductase
MARALELAARGDWRVGRNPKVGAVLVREGALLAEAWHQESGGAHAEAALLAALRAGGGDPRGATLYVSLEPCGPFEGKRTPPCVEALLQAGLARVVVAQADPNPLVAGRSLARLRQAGVEVVTGVLERQARRLNGPFGKWMTAGRPYVTAKWAMSLDGKIAARGGDSRWISGPTSRRRAHALRGEVEAVVIGSGTALQDDPLLTRRDAPGRDPLRVVVDARARLPLTSQLVATAGAHPLLVCTSEAAPVERVRALQERGALTCPLPDAPGGGLDPEALLDELARRDVRHLLLEGGGRLLGSFFSAGLVDRVVCFVAPKLLGGDAAPGPFGGQGADAVARALPLEGLQAEPSGEDVLLSAHLRVY